MPLIPETNVNRTHIFQQTQQQLLRLRLIAVRSLQQLINCGQLAGTGLVGATHRGLVARQTRKTVNTSYTYRYKIYHEKEGKKE